MHQSQVHACRQCDASCWERGYCIPCKQSAAPLTPSPPPPTPYPRVLHWLGPPSSITPPLLEYIAALGVDDGRGLLTRTVMAHGMAQKLKEHPVWSGLARGAQVWVGGEPACSAGSESVSVTPPQQCEG